MLETGTGNYLSASTDVGAPQSAAASEPPPNTAPVFSVGAEGAIYTENETRQIDAAITLTDNGNTLSGVKIEITGGFVRAEDRLVFTSSAATGDIRVAVTLDKNGQPVSPAGSMLLESPSGAATLAQWQAAARAVGYSNSSENPTLAARTFTFSASDGKSVAEGALIGTTTRTLDVARVNDAPTASASLERTVGSEDTVISGRVYAGSDPDGDALTYILEGTPAGVTLTPDGRWTYTPPEDFSGSSSFAYRVSDGLLPSAPKTVSIIVEPVSETPTPFKYQYDGLYFEIGGSESDRFSKKIGDAIYLEIGGSASLDYNIGFGLIVSAVIPDNEVEVKYGIDLVEKISDVEFTLNKQSFVDTSNWKQGTSTISSNGVNPNDLELAVDLKAALRAKLDFSFDIGGGIEIDFGEIDFGPFGTLDLGSISESFSESFGGTILDINTGGSLRLFTLDVQDPSFSQALEYENLRAGSIDAKLPNAIVQSSSSIIVDDDKYGNLNTRAHSDNMLSATLDLDAIVASVLGLPSTAFGGSFQKDIGPFYGSLDYDIVTAALTGGFALEQEFTFTAGDVDVFMTSNFAPAAATNGQIINSQAKEGKLGETFTFDTPQGEGSFTVTATYVLDGVITSKVGLYGRTSFDYKLLGATIGAGVYVDFELATLDESFEIGFGPVLEDSLGIAEGSLVTLFTTDQDVELELFTHTYTIEYENFYIGEDDKDDLFTMTRRQVEADGKSGNDRITGNALDNSIQLGAGDDSGFGRAGADKIYGGLGNDDIEGETGADLLDGGEGNDFLKGGTENDELMGGSGDDRLEGGADNDKLSGDDGRDYLAGEAGDDLIFGGIGNDEIDGGADQDVIDGGDGDDLIRGGSGRDGIKGGLGHDRIEGGDDADKIDGELGNDRIFGGSGIDELNGGSGEDVLDGGVDDDVLFGVSGDDILAGGLGADVLDGGSGMDRLAGGEGRDRLAGSGGNDLIDGGAGVDQLRGDSGNDVFIFLSEGDIGTAGLNNHDVIADFAIGYDKIDLSALYLGKAFSGLKAGATPDAYGLAFSSSGGRTLVVGDTNGDRIADFTLELTGTIRLKASDFITSEAGWASHFAPLGQTAPNFAVMHSELVLV